MPELPEVETVRRELEEQILGLTITALEIKYPKCIRGEIQQFQQTLVGNQFQNLSRRGKLLQMRLEKGKHWMLAHLKMTGQFLVRDQGKISAGIFPLLYAAVPGGKKTAGHFREEQERKAQDDKHCHLVFSFENGMTLSWRDQRKFGYLQLVTDAEREAINNKYGIDPLYDHFTEETFRQAFKGRKKSVKAVLMDQHLIAGVGNIYADEICFRVGVRPHRSVQRLTKMKTSELFHATKEVIQEAVHNKGTTFRDFQRSDGSMGKNVFNLQAYGRSGEKCLRCGTGKISKIMHLGRGTHFCPNCQC